ncbi:N-acetylglucosamine-6-phosphate deacetylase [Oceanicola granulosus HTCC2516]|uniref:N-acetylglucosamine-6-phosphate deacetylase n=1 Tax=Oceanicola granulosus (strain ATCC BAA-861 / DSM 15982 / KCTC 12143 / HTCC2516) TaxID=314256 RepID=Q2CJ83_OCEGH|nr:amidohydrolase family protein [Oceanicola granulosus]EAR52717.1 N-acetylglucosamine-6-phosphate deacetylase [Oceanicola granulosus HTCC2516]
MSVNQRWRNVTSVTPGGLDPRDLLIEGARIAGFLPRDAPTGSDWQVIDGGGAVLFPGMIDLLQHGMFRHLYGDAEPGAVAAASEFLLSTGCTGFLPSFGCTPTPRMVEVLAALAAQCDEACAARALGVHSEGPCFALAGAHNPDNLARPGAELARTMCEAAGGRLAAVTLAPELPGAEAFVRALKAEGVSVHLGHSAAAPHDVPRYVGWGIDAVTHMFNVMPPLPYDGMGLHPYSLPDALLAERDLPLGLICDGIHTDPGFVRLLAQLPAHRVFLETDAMKFAGAEDTSFEFYPGYRVHSRKGHAVRDDRGGLCGSSLTPEEAMLNFLRLGETDLVRAAHATSLVPARVLGREADLGSLRRGRLADFAVLDPVTHAVRATVVGGRELYRAD